MKTLNNTTEKKKIYKLEIHHDSYPENPFTEWDCNPPLMYSSGRDETDFSNGEILQEIKNKATYNKVIRHQKEICNILELNHDYYKENDFTPDQKYNEIISEMDYISDIEKLAKLCELFKIPYLYESSRGYSQGDYANVLVVITEEWINKVGADPKNNEKNLEGAKELFDAWAWGDVYGYKLYKVSFCECCDRNNEIEIDSCWGFFGDDHTKNGIIEHLPEEARELIINEQYETIY